MCKEERVLNLLRNVFTTYTSSNDERILTGAGVSVGVGMDVGVRCRASSCSVMHCLGR